MADSSRVEDLRRRVQRDPTSIAFAQLGEELRRAGQMQEALETCRTGLTTHPGYVSARVTLGRALIALNQLDEAKAELERVLRRAPENLAAIRGLADIYRRRGNTPEALTRYRAALSLAHNDPELQQIVTSLSRDVERDHTQETPAPVDAGDARRERASVSSELNQLPGLASRAPQPLPLHPERDHAVRTLAALERFLEAIGSGTEVD